jgi:hypothetical protein
MIKISVFHNTNGYKYKVLNRFIAKFWQECLHEWNDSKKECITVDKTMDIDIEWDVTFLKWKHKKLLGQWNIILRNCEHMKLVTVKW